MPDIYCDDCGTEMWQEDIELTVKNLGVWNGKCWPCNQDRISDGEVVTHF